MVMKGGRSNIFSANDVLSFQSSLRTYVDVPMFHTASPEKHFNMEGNLFKEKKVVTISCSPETLSCKSKKKHVA